MNKETIEIKKGMKLTCINTKNKFKIDVCNLYLSFPLTRENVTKNALILLILERGTNKFNTNKIINEELEKMYGAILACDVEKVGNYGVLKFSIESINDRYTINKNENLLKQEIDMLIDFAFNPFVENGMFYQDYFEHEKENLKTIIESDVDDKDSFAYHQALTNMFGKNGFGLYRYGYVEDLDAITNEDLFSYYNYLISNSEINIGLSGNFDLDYVSQIIFENEIIKKLPEREELIKVNPIKTSLDFDNVNYVIEKLDVTQGKLVIGLDSYYKKENMKAVGQIYNAILGGTANSLIFQNVREKEGLCYSGRSVFINYMKSIFIRCGIQIENYEKTFNLLKEQLKIMQEGNFSDSQFDDAKMSLTLMLKGLEEEQGSELSYYVSQEIIKNSCTIEEYINDIEKVTREDIIEFANMIKINTVYFLTKND